MTETLYIKVENGTLVAGAQVLPASAEPDQWLPVTIIDERKLGEEYLDPAYTWTDKSAVMRLESRPPAAVNAQLLKSMLIESVQSMLDRTAQGLGYDDLRSACTYIGDPNPRFDAEGRALRDWRSAVWTSCIAILGEVEAGQRAIPSPAQLIAELPAFE